MILMLQSQSIPFRSYTSNHICKALVSLDSLFLVALCLIQIRHKELTIENDIGFATYKTLEDLSFIRNTDILEDLISACKKSLYVSEIS